ncbi:MAG: hypothetical protein GX977_03425, partial [Firmicutes bacterium]|nr:hypothetical protein [Bacillota bacterium]
MLIERNKYGRVVTLTVILVLLIGLTSSDYSRAAKHPLVDELDDTVDVLASFIQRAENSRAAHPAFLLDLNEILAGLQALPDSLDEVAASKAQKRGSAAKEIRVEASTQTDQGAIEKTTEETTESRTEETSGNSWAGTLLKVVQDAASLPGLIEELGSAIKDIKGITTESSAKPGAKSESTSHSEPSESIPLAPLEPAASASPTFLIEPAEVDKVSSDYAKDTKAQLVVLDSLVAQGATAIHEIIPYLESEDSHVVYQAIEALETLGSEAAPAVPALARRLSIPDTNSK